MANKYLLTYLLTYLDLAYWFDVSRPVVTRVVSTWHVIMDVCLSPFISWRICDALHKTVPQCFIDLFGYKTSIIIDCFEIFIDRPTSLMARAQTFSNYEQVFDKIVASLETIYQEVLF